MVEVLPEWERLMLDLFPLQLSAQAYVSVELLCPGLLEKFEYQRLRDVCSTRTSGPGKDQSKLRLLPPRRQQ